MKTPKVIRIDGAVGASMRVGRVEGPAGVDAADDDRRRARRSRRST